MHAASILSLGAMSASATCSKGTDGGEQEAGKLIAVVPAVTAASDAAVAAAAQQCLAWRSNDTGMLGRGCEALGGECVHRGYRCKSMSLAVSALRLRMQPVIRDQM